METCSHKSLIIKLYKEANIFTSLMEEKNVTNFDEEVISIFKGYEPRQIPWQPRIEHWYNVNRITDNLPTCFKGLNIIDIYRSLNAYMRVYIFANEVYGFRMPPYGGGELQSPIRVHIKNENDIKIKRYKEGNKVVTIYSTSLGRLSQVEHSDNYGLSWHPMEYPIKNIEDLKIMEEIFENIEYTFDSEKYLCLKNWVNERGSIWACSPRSPLAMLIIELMGLEKTFISLYREHKKVEEFMETIKEANLKWIRMIQNSPIKIVTIPDNLDIFLINPRLFEKYCLEYYMNFCEKMHKAGKFVLVHADGRLKGLLPLIKQSGVDGIEAVTFKPVGDVTIEEVHSIFRNEIVLIDGLPYIYFLNNLPINELERVTIRVVETFSPKLVLGISDELPPNGEIERVKIVSDILSKIKSG